PDGGVGGMGGPQVEALLATRLAGPSGVVVGPAGTVAGVSGVGARRRGPVPVAGGTESGRTVVAPVGPVRCLDRRRGAARGRSTARGRRRLGRASAGGRGGCGADPPR